MDNILYNIGDSLIVNIRPQIRGKIQFSGYTDTVVGITPTRYLKKEYRISEEGIFWTDWNLLTNENLALEQYIVENFLTIEIRYTRVGTDQEGTIEFKNIQFTGTREEIPFIAPTIKNSIFKDTIQTDYLRQVEINIFKKLYFRGILPKYITRAENLDKKEDKDFIDLFSSIARFFALIISFFKRFENFGNDVDLMREQVRQYGIYFDESNVSLEQLKYLAQNIYNEIRKRGTEMIFKRQGDVLKNGNIVPIDGEFVRLLRNKRQDELLYENVPIQKIGWCLGQSSPLYRGTSQSIYLNKTAEKTQDFQSLSNFVLGKSGVTSDYSLKTVEQKKVLSLKTSNGTVGLGRIDNEDVINKLYVADSKLDYEITFAFKVVNAGNIDSKICFAVEGFDNLQRKLNDAFIMPNGNYVTETFFERSLSKFKLNQWYFVRGIISAYSTINVNESKTNMGIGTNLYFNNSFVKYILPKIQLISSGANAEINVWDYKVRPLVRGKNILPLKNGQENSHSLGFLQSQQIFYTYARNNNNNQSEEEITSIIEKYLYAYNNTNLFVFLSNF